MSNSTALVNSPLALSSMLLSVIYFVLVAGAAVAWNTGIVTTPLTAVDVGVTEETAPLTVNAILKKKHRTTYMRSNATFGGNTMVNCMCPAEPDCTSSKCRSFSSMCFILRVLLFFTSWGLFIGSALNEFPSFSFSMIWSTLPTNFALMWAFLFTTAGGILDFTALLIVMGHCDSCYTKSLSLRCPLRRPDRVGA